MNPSRSIPTALVVGLLAIALPGHADEAPNYNGAELFKIFCAGCHGARARGNGPMTKSLKIAAPDLTLIADRHAGEFPAEVITRIIDGRELRPAHRQGEMPVWGQEFYGTSSDDAARRARSNELIGRLVDYLRSLQR